MDKNTKRDKSDCPGENELPEDPQDLLDDIFHLVFDEEGDLVEDGHDRQLAELVHHKKHTPR